MNYASFWQRLAAAAIDCMIFIPLTGLGFWAMSESTTIAVLVSASTTAAYLAYAIVGHAIWGQTLGKHVSRIRVRSLDGTALTWRQSAKRSLVDIVLGIASTVAYAVVLLSIPVEVLQSLRGDDLFEIYDRTRPLWAKLIEYTYWAWLVSEVVTVLFNRRRRAIHDFIGGTVVLNEAPDRAAALGTWPVIDIIGIVGSAGIALMFLLGAGYAFTVQDRQALLGCALIAGYAAIIAGLFVAAGMDRGHHRRRRVILRSIAGVMLVVPVVLILLAIARMPAA